MQPNDHLEVKKNLHKWITDYYKRQKREVRYFMESEDTWGGVYTHFLIDRKRVIRYGFGTDRGMLLGSVEIGIGPAYFGAAAFWSYENYERFVDSVDVAAVNHNLGLLDEFWRTNP